MLYTVLFLHNARVTQNSALSFCFIHEGNYMSSDAIQIQRIRRTRLLPPVTMAGVTETATAHDTGI
jgi:hypothetical protein